MVQIYKVGKMTMVFECGVCVKATPILTDNTYLNHTLEYLKNLLSNSTFELIDSY